MWGFASRMLIPVRVRASMWFSSPKGKQVWALFLVVGILYAETRPLDLISLTHKPYKFCSEYWQMYFCLSLSLRPSWILVITGFCFSLCLLLVHFHSAILFFGEREAVVVSVKNLSGILSINADGSWVCEGNHKIERHSDPVSNKQTNDSSVLFCFLRDYCQLGLVFDK